MATRAQLVADIMGWLDRRDVEPLVAGWIQMAETDIISQLRAQVMVVAAVQSIDAPLISLPKNFASMESLRDATTGESLTLEDHWTGPLQGDGGAASAYRIVGGCIEFLPWPPIPSNPPLIGWQPQRVRMVWYQGPQPLVDAQDTNDILERHYAIYLFGACRYGALFELDDDRATQVRQEFNDAVTTANLWKQSQQFSGAPLRAVQSVAF